MKKHMPSEEMKKDLDNLLSKLTAMEIVSKDEFQTNTVKILRALVEGQIHSINEFDHLKKAIDLVAFLSAYGGEGHDDVLFLRQS